jgi:hypothetical protein
MDLNELRKLAGIKQKSEDIQENISYTGTEKKRLERELGIEVGTPEWFKLWFARPYLTGESPIDKKGKSDGKK